MEADEITECPNFAVFNPLGSPVAHFVSQENRKFEIVRVWYGVEFFVGKPI